MADSGGTCTWRVPPVDGQGPGEAEGLAMRRGPRTRTRRAVLGGGAGIGGAALIAACGLQGSTTAGPSAQIEEVLWALHFAPEDPRSVAWTETWRRAAEATGVRVNAVSEGSDRWTKRQAEYAAGTTTVDIMGNQTNWVIAGGLTGIFADHSPFMRRDRVDLKQFYKADLETWGWKGKLWAVPYQSGGEVVHYNKALFDAKGVKHPRRDWTYDDLLEACRKLNDPQSGKFALTVGQNGVHYMMGTFMLNFGGKRLNDAKDKALYGDDARSIQGAELDVDLHVKYRFTPPREALASLPQGKAPMDVGMVALEIEGFFRQAALRAAIGPQNLDWAPPPKGPTGIQTAAVGGNAWSILALSKARDAAWQVLRWIYGKDGIQTAWVKSVGWPSSIPAANSALWLDQFKGTNLADCAKVWESSSHDILALPEGDQAWTTMNEPTGRALQGAISTREALLQSATALNELFSRRPAAWK
jgi:ABC-type glycerol-3-phosphate transport system substrate-binding protein